MTPTSLEQAENACKLARAALGAWEAAFYGQDVPRTIAEPLAALIEAGNQAIGAGILASIRRKVRTGDAP